MIPSLMIPPFKSTKSTRFAAKHFFLPLLLSSIAVFAQRPGGGLNQQQPSASSSQSSGNQSYSGSTTTGGTAPSQPSTAPGQNPFFNSVPEGKATGTVLQLSIKEAIERALRNNLGLLIAGDSSLAARGEKWKELSNLLPNVSAAATQSVEQIDL